MKKIFYPMMALAVAAFTFTACEDVPEPYTNPYDQHQVPDEAVLPDPAGTGTLADPYNVGGVLNYINELGADVTSPNDVYITGIVISIKEQFSAQYGNAQFDISDNANGGNKFTVYRALYLGNKKWVEGDKLLNEGDEVVICGKVVNYKGTTPETQQNAAYVYSINGEGGSGTPSGGDAIGTKDEPVNVARALADIDKLDEGATTKEFYYIKGKIKTIKTKAESIAQYKNIDYIITDDGNNELTVFRGKNLNNTDFTEAGQINVGDEVTVYGQLTKYKNPNTGAIVPEVAQGNYIVAKGSGGTTPPPAGDKGTAEKPYSVTEAIAAGSGTGVYVKGFIVGNITGQVLQDGAHFDTTGDSQTNILIAASADETEVANCMPVQLPSGAVRTALNLKDNPGNYKKEVTLYGNIEKYFGATGLKTVTYAILDGNDIGTKPNGGGSGNDQPSGDAKGSGTQADPWNVVAAVNAINAGSVPEEAFVKGIIVELSSFNSTYGSCTYWIADSKNAATKLQVYGGLNLDKGQFSALEDLSIGDEVVVAGKLKIYNGTPEFDKNNYLVSITKAGNNGGGNSGANSLDTNFKANGQGDWTLVDVKALPEGISYVWNYDDRYGMKASAYVGGSRYETDSWLVSPAINLANGGTMTFKQALNYATSEYVKVMYTTTNGTGNVNPSEWNEASVDTWPAGNNWNFIESHATLPAGTVRVAFRYTSTTSTAATWEIESASIQ